MPKKTTSHPYSNPSTFERLMVLIATLVQYPGVGCPPEYESNLSFTGHHDALLAVQQKMQEIATILDIDFGDGYPATATIRKDLETLRRYGILEKRMYRWGYYLGTNGLRREELQVALAALASQDKYQGNPQVRRLYAVLEKRLRGLNLELEGELFYPVRQHLNRTVVYTDPVEMMARGENRNTLFHQLDIVERAILQGQALEVCRTSDPYKKGRVGSLRIWPLQLIYYDIAWYLLYEAYEPSNPNTGHLAVGRVNRFADYCKVITTEGRGLAMQEQSLRKAHTLLDNGWGLYLGNLEEQQAELEGKQTFEMAKVRFFTPVIPFILEGECRHPRQHKIKLGPKDPMTGELAYVEYAVSLPPRSLKEFGLWVYKHLENAQVITPAILVEWHHQGALTLVARYSQQS